MSTLSPFAGALTFGTLHSEIFPVVDDADEVLNDYLSS
jgi:hypothetical protein